MSIESKVLGQQVAYPTDYCPSILVPVPRSLNREIYNIHAPEELFRGFDTWHAYEAGFLTQNGLPVCGVLKLVYPASSPYIVESKSLKLYLNSLNMTRLGEDIPSGIETYLQTVKSDLEQILQTRVEATFFRQIPENRISIFKITLCWKPRPVSNRKPSPSTMKTRHYWKAEQPEEVKSRYTATCYGVTARSRNNPIGVASTSTYKPTAYRIIPPS